MSAVFQGAPTEPQSSAAKQTAPPTTDSYRTNLERRAEFSGCPREITRGMVDFQTWEEVYSTDVEVIFFAGTFVTFKQFYPPPRV